MKVKATAGLLVAEMGSEQRVLARCWDADDFEEESEVRGQRSGDAAAPWGIGGDVRIAASACGAPRARCARRAA
jgi:hypothetical protein